MKTKFINVSDDKQVRQDLRTRAMNELQAITLNIAKSPGQVTSFPPRGEVVFSDRSYVRADMDRTIFYYMEDLSTVTLDITKGPLAEKIYSRIF